MRTADNATKAAPAWEFYYLYSGLKDRFIGVRGGSGEIYCWLYSHCLPSFLSSGARAGSVLLIPFLLADPFLCGAGEIPGVFIALGLQQSRRMLGVICSDGIS